MSIKSFDVVKIFELGVGVGVLIGSLIAIMAMPSPAPRPDCDLYKVRYEPAVSYVLRPPILREAFQPTPIAKPLESGSGSETQITTDEKPESIEQTDKPRRHHRRHWRRHWRR